MFSKNTKRTGSPVTTPPAPPSIISRDLNIVGDLNSEGEIQIDGSVNGDIRTKALVIGETAIVNGEIVADAVRVLGSVNGQIKAKVVKLAASAHVVGDILHEDLSIETGAFLEGHCKRMAVAEPAKTEAAASGKPSQGEGATKKPPSHPVNKPKPATTA